MLILYNIVKKNYLHDSGFPGEHDQQVEALEQSSPDQNTAVSEKNKSNVKHKFHQDHYSLKTLLDYQNSNQDFEEKTSMV